MLGDTASFAGVLDAAPNPDLVGVPFAVWVVDNGPPGGETPDLISPLVIFPEDDPDRPLLPPAFPNVCPQPFPSLYGYYPVTDGNIVVEDQSPAHPPALR